MIKTTTSRDLCSSCEASPTACTSLQTLGGRRCCDRCDHEPDSVADLLGA